ncbi:PIN domain-containing protein [Bowmanella denitrificans]|uniref:PIN domain-containing protein n=1 Tax=Bowmanella denitrificans TaxID=366582 RepID=UPI000C99F55C|nr:PIN domain-containing protein [Bowmanella denitrificans]
MKKKRPLRLLVVFDTNALYTQVASDLVQPDVSRIILDNSNHPDLQIEWFLPEAVIGERAYQMLSRAKDLLPNMKKMEKLLGHSFGIGEDTLKLHVNNAIEKSTERLNIKVISCNTKNVDWSDIISRSINREPPFEPNEKEKGFRDSVIANSFIQLMNSSPITPTSCLLAFVTNDKALQNYLSELSKSSKNVRILSSLDDLEVLINTLVSTVPEDLVAELTIKAAKLFFDKDNDKCIFTKEKISEQIKSQFSEVFLPIRSESRNRDDKGPWWISGPIFIKKERQRIFWSSVVSRDLEIFHYENEGTPLSATLSPFTVAELLGGKSNDPNSANWKTLDLNSPNFKTKKVVDFKEREKFEVHWNANLSQSQNLTTPKLDKIVHLGTEILEN